MTVEATIDAGPGGFWPESRPQARCPSSRVSTVLRYLVLGSFGQNPGYRHGVRRVNSGQCSGTSSRGVWARTDRPGNHRRWAWGVLARIQATGTMPVESSAGTWSWGVLAKIQATGTYPVQSTVDSAQAPHPAEFGPELTVQAIIDAGPGGFWPESRPQARCPSSRVPAPGPGEFWPKSRLQARIPSSQQWTVLRHLIPGSLGQN